MNDLDPILRTIREVEESLDRRSARAGALIMMTWGAVATAIFLFYALYELEVPPIGDLDHAMVHWIWAPPVVLGYLVTALTQVRLGRMRATERAASARRLLLLISVPVTIVTLALALGFGWQWIPAMWVAFLGYAHIAWSGRAEWADRAIAIASFAVAAVLALPPLWEWANLVAAVWYAAFLFGHGIYRYHAA